VWVGVRATAHDDGDDERAEQRGCAEPPSRTCMHQSPHVPPSMWVAGNARACSVGDPIASIKGRGLHESRGYVVLALLG
jgi:hypothetical protein